MENSYVRHLSCQSLKTVKFYTAIYNMTKAKIPGLKHVIFFSRVVLFLDESASSDSKMRNQIQLVYQHEDIQRMTGIPTIEDFINNVNSIEFTKVFQYLSQSLETYLNQIQNTAGIDFKISQYSSDAWALHTEKLHLQNQPLYLDHT